MTAKLLGGKDLAQKIKEEIALTVRASANKPDLAVILIGNNPASKIYVKLKEKACNYCDINVHKYIFEENSSEREIINTINFLNKDPEINGILVQLPLPKKFNTDKIISSIDPQKDVDGFHPQNIEKLKKGEEALISPLAHSIVELIISTNQNLKNKKILVLSNSEHLLYPIKVLLPESKVSWTSVAQKGFIEKCQAADVLIVAIGKENFIQDDMVKKDAIIIDCGTNETEEGVEGDVDESVDDIVAYRSPVPGGVGPLTIAFLLKNVWELSNK